MPHEVVPSPVYGFPPVAAARPCWIPRWKLAKRFLVSSADLPGAGWTGVPLAAEAAAVPGTRFACGCRFGSPVDVVPSDDGA